jgi:uncharacterized protein
MAGRSRADAVAALLTASHDGDLAGVRRALRSGAHVDAADSEGCTALLFASQEGHLHVVAALLAAGAGVNTPNGRAPLRFTWLRSASTQPSLRRCWRQAQQ